MAKILIVDDNPADRNLLVRMLSHEGHLLLEASDGAEALALVSAERPDLVISDILMPTMDGYELVRCLRSAPEIAGTPVIFCTAHFRERDARDLAQECSVSHVLAKPVLLETVIRVVNECLGTQPAAPAPTVDQEFEREHLRILTDKLSEQTGKLTNANLRLQALLNMSLDLASEKDPSRLIDRFCTAARDLIAARYCVVAIPSNDGRGPPQIAVAGTSPLPDGVHFPPDTDLFPGVIKSRRPLRLRNPGGDPATLGFPLSFRPFESLLVAPIVSPTHVYGWLCLFHRLGAPEFSAEDEQLAGILAPMVGRVYENGMLHISERLYANEIKLEMASRRKAQQESAQLADIVQSSDDAIISMTLDGNILTWNRSAERIFGYPPEDIQGRPASQLFDPEGAEALRGALEALVQATLDPKTFSSKGEALRGALEALVQEHSITRYETLGITRGDGTIEMAVTISPILRADGGLSGASAIVRDVTSKKRLQRQLLVAQKMEAIGRLSAGIAHDFNNLLTVILGYSALILGGPKEHNPDYAEILEIHKAAEQAAALTHQLLAFSSRQVTQPRVLDLNAIVADMDRMLRRVIGEDIDLVTVSDSSLGSIRADSGQMEQIVMNLAVNARDAMPEGGKLTLQTANLYLDETLSVRHTVVPPGEYVVLSMTDTGIGMDAATQDRIFEPFFTTKEPGRGTGLGLSTIYGIVEQGGGAIAVYSEPGHGTTFRIFLRRVWDAVPTIPILPLLTAPARGSETILVVEDEDGVRALILAVLNKAGYKILQARNGGEALLICEQHPKKISLMISDITMPGMTGIELARRFQTIRPDMKVLYISGYAEKAVIHQRVLDADLPFLEKPFPPQVLARKVREVLDGPELPDFSEKDIRPATPMLV
jgi:signal transduction histidine kinase/DNA-binding response OmpR family regulator